MAVVSYYNNLWHNADGLAVKFGTDEALVQRGGAFAKDAGGRRVVEFVVDLETLSTAAPAAGGNECIVLENVLIPSGAFIESVEVLVTEETAGTNANLDLGLVRQDRSTELDFNGLLAAADVFNGGTDLGTYTTYNVGTTEAGALIGTKLANAGYITASPDTADWTAGKLRIRVYWSVPLTADV